MVDPTNLWLFLASAIVLLVIPGASVLYVTTRSLEQGLGAGFVSTLGLAAGDLVQVVAVVVGLSALVASSEVAFTVVRYLGAAYLVYLAVRQLLAGRKNAGAAAAPAAAAPSRLFVQGLVVNALNPKTTLFFIAFFSVFVDTDRGWVWLQTLVLGMLFVLLGMVTNGGWAVVSSLFHRVVSRHAGFPRLQRYVSAGVYLLLAGLVGTTSFQER